VLVALSERPSARFRTVLAALILALAAFVVIGAAGLPLLARYLLPAGALLIVLGCGAAATATHAGLRWAAIGCLVLAIPGTLRGIADAAADSRERRALQADLRRLPIAGRCGPLSAVSYRHVPIIAYAHGLAPASIHPQPDSDVIVLPRSARAAESLQSAGDPARLLLAPPPGFKLAAQTRDWALAARC
jgi:hypothetical protein